MKQVLPFQGYAWIIITALEYTLLFTLVLSQEARDVTVCQWEKFEAKCPADHVIIITHAVYGRMRIGRCVKENLGYLGCQADVKNIADAKCSGRRECQIPIPDPDLDREKPCSELQNYLEATYECRKVESLDDTRCHRCDYVRVQNEIGFLASAVTSESGCGSMDCPWLISGGPGQYIRVTLLDFSRRPDGGEEYSGVCKVYATIKEKNSDKRATICGGQGRDTETEVYVSQGPALEIRILKNDGENDVDQDNFLLKYEVFGCADLVVDGATVRHSGRTATVSCDFLDKEWIMTCNGTHWIGTSTNCSLSVPVQDTPGPQSGEPVFNTTSLIIMAAVAIIICTLVVIIGVVCFKICTQGTRRRRPPPHSYEDPPDLCHPPQLAHDTYCVTRVPHVSDGTMSLDRCVTSKVTCKTYSFENGPKNEYEHICDSSTVPRVEFNT